MAINMTADEIEQVFHTCLAAGDIEGVDAALRVLAVRDPHRAQRLLDTTKAALAIVQAIDSAGAAA